MGVGEGGEKYAVRVMDLSPHLDLMDGVKENDEHVVVKSCGAKDGSVRSMNRREKLEVLDKRRSVENDLRLVVVELVGDAVVVVVVAVHDQGMQIHEECRRRDGREDRKRERNKLDQPRRNDQRVATTPTRDERKLLPT